MKKKTLAILTVSILIISLTACGSSGSDDSEDESTVVEEVENDVEDTVSADVEDTENQAILDSIEDMEVVKVDDGTIFWNVKFNENYDDSFDVDDFIVVIRECMRQKETKADDVSDYDIEGTNSDKKKVFEWSSSEDQYTIYQYIYSDDETQTKELTLTEEEYNDILSAKDD